MTRRAPAGQMWQNIVLAAFAAVLSLLGGELFLRHVYAPDVLRTTMAVAAKGGASDSSLRWVYRDGAFAHFAPDQTATIAHVEYQTSATINEHGWRVSFEPSFGRAYDAVFAGDSFTFGIGLEDDETFPWLLSQALGFSFANLGVPGSDPARHLDIIQANHGALGAPPLYFIVIFLGNDFEAVLPPARAVGARQGRSVLHVLNDLLFHRILRDSYTAQLIKMAFNNVRARVRIAGDRMLADQAGITFYFRDVPVAREAALRAGWTAWLEDLDALAGTSEAAFALILLPDRTAVEPASIDYIATYYGFDSTDIDRGFKRRLLLDVFQEHEMAVLDTTDCLSSAYQGAPFYYEKDNHMTPLGARTFASCISDFVAEATRAARH